jgi:hypothetical protein
MNSNKEARADIPGPIIKRRPGWFAWTLAGLALASMLSGMAEIPPIIHAGHLAQNTWTQVFDVVTGTLLFKYFITAVSSLTMGRLIWVSYASAEALLHHFVQSPHVAIDIIWVLALVTGLLAMMAAIFEHIRDLENVSKSSLGQVGSLLITACCSFAFGGGVGQRKSRDRIDELTDKLGTSYEKILRLHALVLKVSPEKSVPPELDL